MGTMCAMYGCEVEASAEAMEPSSRALRAAAMRRRRAVILRLDEAAPGAGFFVTCAGWVSTFINNLYSIAAASLETLEEGGWKPSKYGTAAR